MINPIVTRIILSRNTEMAPSVEHRQGAEGQAFLSPPSAAVYPAMKRGTRIRSLEGPSRCPIQQFTRTLRFLNDRLSVKAKHAYFKPTGKYNYL